VNTHAQQSLFRFRLFVLVLLGLGTAGWAQQLTGTVEGTVNDASGAVVPGVSILLTNADNGATRTQTSDADGNYYFSALTPGHYTLKASAPNFNTTEMQVDVQLNRLAHVDVVMTVGQVKTTVEVTAAAETVDTASTSVATNIGSKVVTDLPIITRDITRMVELMPGTTQSVGTTAGGSQVVDISGNYAQSNGTRRSQSVFYLDGSDNTGGWRNQGMQMPNPDTIAEVQVISSTASAEFGKQPGTSLNAITKSGTNSLHGTINYAFHAQDLNANTWAANLAGSPRPADVQKWVTGTIGGPIIKNKTFFFISYQRFQDATPGSQSTLPMPTAAMVKGDFSGIPGFNIALKNPATNLPIGTVIPSNLINPIAAKLASRFPTIPQYSNDPLLGRFFWQYFDEVASNEGLAKIDHQLTDRQQLSFSFLATSGAQSRPDNVSGLTNNVPDWGGTSLTGATQQTLSGRHTWTASPNMILESRGSFSRTYATRGRTQSENLNTLGGVWPAEAPGINMTLPTISFTGGPTARGGQYSDLLQQNFRGLSTLSWAKGHHFLKFGGEVEYNEYSRVMDYDNAQLSFTGTYSFSGGPLNGPWPTLSNPTGDPRFAYSWADFLLGRLSSFSATAPSNVSFTGLASFYFAQDEWRIHKNLTITAGLRYELYGAQKSANTLASYVAGYQSTLYPKTPVGIAFTGDPGIAAGIRTPSPTNFAPRLGVAWDPFGKGRVVARAGGGIYYAYPPLSIIEQIGTNLSAPTFTGNNASLSDPWGTARASSNVTTCQFTGCVAPNFSTDPSLRSWAPVNIYGFSPDAGAPYSMQFNSSLEVRPFNDLTVQAAYVGNRARKGWTVRDANLPIWQPGANTGNINARRPNQLWRQIDLISTDASENYNAGQFIVTYSKPKLWARFTTSVQQWLTTSTNDAEEVGINSAPTDWASNPRNISGDRASVSPSLYMRGYVIYTLPSLGNGWTKKYFGNWQAATSWSYQNGDRLNVNYGTDLNFDGFSADRPDLVAPITYPRTTVNNVTTWFSPTSFAMPAAPSAANPYPFGNLPRNAITGPSQFFLDASLSKTTPLTERFELQLRMDMSNLLNHPNLSDPTVTVANSNFGLIQTKSGGGRIAQVNLRLLF